MDDAGSHFAGANRRIPVDMQPLVSVRGLSKDYFDAAGNVVHACNNVHFDALPGEVFGVLGTNGAGKTTILRLLSTVLKPTRGDAVINGHSVTRDAAAVRKSIGFLSADTGVYGRLTAREMIEYFGRLHGMSDAAIGARLQEIAGSLEMQSFLARRCDKLSTGQKQRVNIARTIIHDPEVFIFDEPTAGLDILAGAQIVRFIRTSRDRGRCVIFSTHVMQEARKLCDRLLIIHQGQTVFCGTAAEAQAMTGTTELEDAFLHVIGESRLA